MGLRGQSGNTQTDINHAVLQSGPATPLGLSIIIFILNWKKKKKSPVNNLEVGAGLTFRAQRPRCGLFSPCEFMMRTPEFGSEEDSKLQGWASTCRNRQAPDLKALHNSLPDPCFLLALTMKCSTYCSAC